MESTFVTEIFFLEEVCNTSFEEHVQNGMKIIMLQLCHKSPYASDFFFFFFFFGGGGGGGGSLAAHSNAVCFCSMLFQY